MPSNITKQLYYSTFSITTSCIIGFALAMYSLLVEMKAEENPTYKAYCDINEHISCTKAFTSQYGKGFGIIGKLFGESSKLNQPNSLFGMMFYTLVFIINIPNSRRAASLLIKLGILASLMSAYLAYILIFVLHDFCFICVATYLINGSLVFFAMYKRYSLTQLEEHIAKKQKRS